MTRKCKTGSTGASAGDSHQRNSHFNHLMVVIMIIMVIMVIMVLMMILGRMVGVMMMNMYPIGKMGCGDHEDDKVKVENDVEIYDEKL